MKTLQKHIDTYTHCLNVIYKDAPASITIIEGDWKQGKTNFAFRLAYDELKINLGMVKRVAANVRCFQDTECTIPSNEKVEYIDNFDMLSNYIKQPGRKVFIYDEALKNTPSKRAMTALNAEWLKIVPELSKGGGINNPGGCHLFVLTQEGSLTEKIFMNPTFKTAFWKKITLKPSHPQFRKMVKLSSKMLRKKITFKNVSPTTINYNPFLSAEWSMHPTEKSLGDLPLELKVALEYAKGTPSTKIQEIYKDELTDRKDVMRHIQKALTILLKDYILEKVEQTEQEETPTTP